MTWSRLGEALHLGRQQPPPCPASGWEINRAGTDRGTTTCPNVGCGLTVSVHPVRGREQTRVIGIHRPTVPSGDEP